MADELQRFLKIPDNFASAIDWQEANRKFNFYTSEQYVQDKGSRSTINRLYYQLRPFMPRWCQIQARRLYSHIQARKEFPHWPIEPVLTNMIPELMGLIAANMGVSEIPYLGFWPDGKKWALVLTHDVEGSEGVRNVERIAEMEERYGFRSSWNFVPERYPLDTTLLENLKKRGFEIGVHGLYHDGLLFSSLGTFRERLPAIHGYRKKWSAAGFRSPATHRNFDWMRELDFEYDSSFPDTDIYEPKPGGCCWIFPYFIGNLMEIPITLPQDHTLLEILRRKNLEVWYEKVRWIRDQHGLALLILHPDYVLTTQRLSLYEEFLRRMRDERDAWTATPVEVSTWWRSRHDSRLVHNHSNYTIEGPAAEHGNVEIFSLSPRI